MYNKILWMVINTIEKEPINYGVYSNLVETTPIVGQYTQGVA